MARKTGPDRETVALVKTRSGGVCECCGVNEGQQIHHRRPRGIGGTRDTSINLPSNLVDICAACHSSIESRRSAASEAGWLVSRLSGVRCCEVPVLCWYGRVVLDDSGGYEVAE